MAEIILPPEEDEETPQPPVIEVDKPTENSKVITIEFEAKKTNKVSTKDTNQQLYTTDTDAWFEFKETSLEGANGAYSVVFRNRHDGSIFQRTGDVVNGVAYYKIPHQEIRHAGKWRGQLVYTLENGNTTAREFDYDVKGHILDGKDVREIVVEDFETLMSQLKSMKDNAEQELTNLTQELRSTTDTAEQNETDRQAFFDDLVEDIDELQANYQELLDTGVLQTNINEKLEELEEEYAPKLTEVTTQLAQTANSKVDKDGSQQVRWANIAQDAREQISGDKVAVVGKDSVGTENLTNNSVNYDKTEYIDEVAVLAKNIIPNGNFSSDSNDDGIGDGWERGGSNVTLPRIENSRQHWTPISLGASGSVRTKAGAQDRIELIANHKYYFAFDYKNIVNVVMNNSSGFSERIAGNVYSDGKISTVFEAPENISVYFVFNAREADVEAHFGNVVLVDLTETFGVGKEPDVTYVEHLFEQVGIANWFDIVNLTDFSKKAIMTARELKVYDPSGDLSANNVNDVLVNLSEGSVKAVPGKNLINPEKNISGTISQNPLMSVGQKQKIDTVNNPNNHVSQKIRIKNTGNLALSNVTIYSITDLSDNVLVVRTGTGGSNTIINSTTIPVDEYYLWISLSTESGHDVVAQAEMSDTVTNFEPYKPVSAVYANGVKLFNYPLEVTGGGDKKKELYDLAIANLEKNEMFEEVQFLKNNAVVGNASEESREKDTQIIDMTDKNNKQKLILHLHKREKESGFGTINNAYLPNAKDDFSDIRITAEDGRVLPYRKTYLANDFDIVPYDWTRQSKMASVTHQDSNGILYQSDRHIRKSADKGKTWTNIPALMDFITPDFNFIAQDDTMYFSDKDTSTLYRSEAPYTSYEAVLDLDPNGEYGNTHISGKSLVQHPDGELFCGLYQTAHRIHIYKSVDNGLTWELSVDWGVEYQHVHGMFVDEHANPPAIYAGLDRGGGVLKTVDKGETWVDLREENLDMPQSTDYGVRYSDPSGYRLLGGETPIVGGHSIIKTTDDDNFRPVLSDGISVNYVVKLGSRLFATGSGAHGFRNGAIYVSRDDAESWEGVYRTAPLLDLWSANDGYRYMEKISENEIFVGPQSYSRPPLRIFGTGNYAELVVDVPEGTNSITVESGHAYPNELPISNDAELSGDKLVHFELNENGQVIKELVSGVYFEDNFEWIKGGKRLSYFYPYITSPIDSNSVKLKSLMGYDIDSNQFDVSEGVTISFWSKLSTGTRFLLFENEVGDKLEIVNGYQLFLNGVNTVSFNYPLIPEPFIKHDILVANDGSINVYTNGLLVTFLTGDEGVEILNALSSGGKIKFLKNVSSKDADAMQHFMIRKGIISEEQLLTEFNAGITDNIK